MTNDYQYAGCNPGHLAHHLVFTSHRVSKTKDSQQNMPGSWPDPTVCEELLATGGNYERYFCELDGSNGTGFLLKPKTTQQVITTSVVSLHDVIASSNINPLDQYLIAANLANSALYHYSSPWIRDWTPKTILFFDKHTDTAPIWMPHIPVEVAYNRGQFGDYPDRNKELYLLGLILLQLGQGRSGELIEDEKMVVKALASLYTTLGKRYKQVVANLLQKGRDRTTDLMEEKNLEEFQSALDVLEGLVEEHTPPDFET